MRKSRLALSLKVCTVVCEVVCVADFLTVCAEAYRMACIEFHLALSLKVCAVVRMAVFASHIWRLALGLCNGLRGGMRGYSLTAHIVICLMFHFMVR